MHSLVKLKINPNQIPQNLGVFLLHSKNTFYEDAMSEEFAKNYADFQYTSMISTSIYCDYAISIVDIIHKAVAKKIKKAIFITTDYYIDWSIKEWHNILTHIKSNPKETVIGNKNFACIDIDYFIQNDIKALPTNINLDWPEDILTTIKNVKNLVQKRTKNKTLVPISGEKINDKKIDWLRTNKIKNLICPADGLNPFIYAYASKMDNIILYDTSLSNLQFQEKIYYEYKGDSFQTLINKHLLDTVFHSQVHYDNDSLEYLEKYILNNFGKSWKFWWRKRQFNVTYLHIDLYNKNDWHKLLPYFFDTQSTVFDLGNTFHNVYDSFFYSLQQRVDLLDQLEIFVSENTNSKIWWQGTSPANLQVYNVWTIPRNLTTFPWRR